MAWHGCVVVVSAEQKPVGASTARYRFSRRFNRPRDPLFVRWCSAKRLFVFSAGFFLPAKATPSPLSTALHAWELQPS
jgi:hypothetical protein